MNLSNIDWASAIIGALLASIISLALPYTWYGLKYLFTQRKDKIIEGYWHAYHFTKKGEELIVSLNISPVGEKKRGINQNSV